MFEWLVWYNVIMPIHKSINKDFFKKWSRDMAYILGFMYADGNMIKNKRGGHYIAVYSNDKYLLRKILDVMESNHKIAERKSSAGMCYQFQIGSKEMFQDLLCLGLTPNKASRMRLPIIPRKFIGDFIRGFFDGDGNVWVGRVHKERKTSHMTIRVYFTSASFDFLKDLQDLLTTFGCGLGSLRKIGNYARIQYAQRDTLLISKIMYNNPHKLFLNRKKLVLEKKMQV
jgi:hypothetical protein